MALWLRVIVSGKWNVVYLPCCGNRGDCSMINCIHVGFGQGCEHGSGDDLSAEPFWLSSHEDEPRQTLDVLKAGIGLGE